MSDVPVGTSSADNVEIRRWSPSWFDTAKPFAANKGFAPKTHMELGETARADRLRSAA